MHLNGLQPHRCAFLLTGGDTLHHYAPSTLPFTLINNYGPTEATVVSSYERVPQSGLESGLPSIGRPIANTQIYILDEHLQQAPIGEVGEMYIGGNGLAKGYLNRPELTAEKFIRHPFSTSRQAHASTKLEIWFVIGPMVGSILLDVLTNRSKFVVIALN